MKKISILSLHLGYGGIEKSIVALANILCQKYEVEIACSYKLYEPAFSIDKRVSIKYLISDLVPNKKNFVDAVNKKKFISALREGVKAFNILHLRRKTMIQYIKTTDADVIIASRDIFDNWLSQYGKNDVLKIGWEHNHYHDDLRYAKRIVRNSSKLDYLVLVSEQLQDFYKKKLENSKCQCVYIPNIIDSIPSNCSLLTEKRLISVGRLSKEKGYMDLLKIYSILFEKHPDWVLDIIGDGPEKDKLQSFIHGHNLEKNVTLHGFRNREYIDEMLHNSSIYVMTSFTESFGIVLIEAMSHGLPCIAFSSAEGACELISSGENGYLIKNRSYPAMIKKIEDLMEDLDTRRKLGKAGRVCVKKYTADVVKEQWYNLIEKK